MPFAILDMAKQFSNDAFVASMSRGVVSRLTNRLPDIQIGDTEFFDLSGRTKGELVGEAAQKSPTPTDAPLRHIRTVKLQYTERFSDEFVIFNRERQLRVIETLAQKWVGSDFQKDLDTIVLHGVNPLTGTQSTVAQDYVTKVGSSIAVQATAATGSALNAALEEAISSVQNGVNGIAFSTKAASELAKLRENGIQLYPSLGKFGINVTTFDEGIRAASAKEVGEYGGLQIVVGDWNALRWGIAAQAPVRLIEYGDPDGLGDLQRQNQIALRYEVIFGYGIANPNALAIVTTSTVSA